MNRTIYYYGYQLVKDYSNLLYFFSPYRECVLSISFTFVTISHQYFTIVKIMICLPFTSEYDYLFTFVNILHL